MLIKTRLPHIHHILHRTHSMLAYIKMMNHLAALFDDLGMLIGLKDNFHQVLSIQPLAELLFGGDDRVVLVRGEEFAVDKLVKLFDFPNASEFFLEDVALDHV